MARMIVGAVALLWGAGVLVQSLDGALAVRGGIDQAGVVLALLAAASLVALGARTLLDGLRR